PDAGAEGGGSGQPGGALPARARARPVRRGVAGRAGTGGGGRRGRARRGGAFLRSLRLGTRGSRLAMTQSGWVAERLREAVPGLSVELVEIRTSGDVIKDVPLGPALGQSFFTKEIEEALLAERVDVAVHSCKDLATTGHDALVIAAIPEREDP